jgi:hypothetical protein
MEALQKEGYSKEDAESIITGEDKGKFKKDGEPAASDELDADLGSDELDLGV